MNKRPRSYVPNISANLSPIMPEQQDKNTRSLSTRFDKDPDCQRNVNDAFNFYHSRHDQVKPNQECPKLGSDNMDVDQTLKSVPHENGNNQHFSGPLNSSQFDEDEDRFIIKVVHGGFIRIFTYRRTYGFDYFRSQLYTNGKQSYKGSCSWFDHFNDRISLVDENDLNSMLDFLELFGERYVKIFLNNPIKPQ
uniref:BTB_2 domain-containing protein n=1 Tax=Strongyloides stercoralis TaxID=6248 RepID=A0A0K0E7E9_STRER